MFISKIIDNKIKISNKIMRHLLLWFTAFCTWTWAVGGVTISSMLGVKEMRQVGACPSGTFPSARPLISSPQQLSSTGIPTHPGAGEGSGQGPGQPQAPRGPTRHAVLEVCRPRWDSPVSGFSTLCIMQASCRRILALAWSCGSFSLAG